MKEFIFGKYIYEYELIKQNRKTLSLTVKPNLKIVLKCPQDTPQEKIENFLQRKWFWLEKQLSFFKKYKRKVYDREYISGEGFFYLGKQYKLTIRKGKEDKIQLEKGKLFVFTTKDVSNGRHNKRLLDLWLENRIHEIFNHRFTEMLTRFNYKTTPTLAIREMKKRWGSFTLNGRILLNPKLIHTPKECIDYVIVHELCHLQHKNHNSRFWKFLEEKFPKWEKTKDKLETIGAGLS